MPRVSTIFAPFGLIDEEYYDYRSDSNIEDRNKLDQTIWVNATAMRHCVVEMSLGWVKKQ